MDIFAAVLYQKRFKKERRSRRRLQETLDLEIKRRKKLEEALKATGASPEQVRAIAGKFVDICFDFFFFFYHLSNVYLKNKLFLSVT